MSTSRRALSLSGSKTFENRSGGVPALASRIDRMTLRTDPLVPRYRFGGFELRPATRELLEGGRAIAIGARAFDVLLALIERRPRLVSKNDLLDLVWSDVVVEEANLHVQVSTLRKILGPHAIATVPGRGYRFTAALDETDQSLDAVGVLERPPQVALVQRTNNLPVSPGALHGRDSDLHALDGWVFADRVVTVVGPGGIGKTRLALAVAQRHCGSPADGVWWIELAPIVEGLHLASTIASVLALNLGVASDPRAALLRVLTTFDALIVLDNCEHLLSDVSTLVRDCLNAAPKVRWLVTSQEPLKVPGERVYRLGPLSVPAEGAAPAEALEHGAVALLVERARAADRRFELTNANVEPAIAICRELDGIALAIEMAAARVPLLGLAGVREKLGERLRLLNVAGGLFRSQTLRSALEWSYSLLTASEQVLFRRLAVFVGGFTLPLAQAVVTGGPDPDSLDEWTVIDALGALVDKSLVVAEGQDEPRYRLLESARAYALERLMEAGEGDALKRRHAEAMAKLIAGSFETLWNLSEAQWLARFAPEIDNLRAAYDFAMAAGLIEPATTLAVDGVVLCRDLHQYLEASQRLESVRPFFDKVDPILAARGYFAIGDYGDALFDGRLRAIEQALTRYRALDDRRGIYMSALVYGELLVRNGRADEAAHLLAEAERLEDPSWPPRRRSVRRAVAAILAEASGDIDTAKRHMREAIALDRAAGWESRVVGKLTNLVAMLLAAGETAEAIALSDELFSLAAGGQEIPGLAYMNLAGALILEGRLAEARANARIGLPLMQRKEQGYIFVDHLALLAAKEGRLTDAARLVGWTDTMYVANQSRRDTEEAQARARTLDLIHATMEPEARERAVRDGARLTEKEAVALALAEPQDDVRR